MNYIVIFTWFSGSEKYAIRVMASTKEQAIADGVKQIISEYRHFDSVEVVEELI